MTNGIAASIRRIPASSSRTWRSCPWPAAIGPTGRHRLPCRPNAPDRLACSRISGSFSIAPLSRTGTQARSRKRSSSPRAVTRRGLAPRSATCRTLGMTAASVRSASAAAKESAARDWRDPIRSPRLGGLPPGKLTSRSHADAEVRNVRRPELFQQQRNSGRTSGQNRAADRFQLTLFGRFGFPNVIAKRRGLRALSCRKHLFSAQHAAIGSRRANRTLWIRQRLARAPWPRPILRCGQAPPPRQPQRSCRRRSTFPQALRSPAIAPHADGVDHANQKPAFDIGHRVAQGCVRGRVVDRLQGNPCPRGQIRIWEQCGERRARPLWCRKWQAVCT